MLLNKKSQTWEVEDLESGAGSATLGDLGDCEHITSSADQWHLEGSSEHCEPKVLCAEYVVSLTKSRDTGRLLS